MRKHDEAVSRILILLTESFSNFNTTEFSLSFKNQLSWSIIFVSKNEQLIEQFEYWQCIHSIIEV